LVVSFGPGSYHYQAFACYDLLGNGTQKLSEYGVWTGDTYGLDAKGLGQTHLNLSQNLIGAPYQSGALFSYEGNPEEVILRVGVSFVSADQACANAEEEIGTSSFESIVSASKGEWNQKLSKIEIDIAGTPDNVTEMFYSSLYRTSLTPVSFPLHITTAVWVTVGRTMLLSRRKACLRTLRPSTLIHCTAAGTR
jgi:putative alpha-1,2-mannosidase